MSEPTEAEWFEGGPEGGRIHARSIEETERALRVDLAQGAIYAQEADARITALEAERDSLLTRVSELLETNAKNWHRADAAESRIESLVGEREELANLRALGVCATCGKADNEFCSSAYHLLSSRETTDSPEVT